VIPILAVTNSANPDLYHFGRFDYYCFSTRLSYFFIR